MLAFAAILTSRLIKCSGLSGTDSTETRPSVAIKTAFINSPFNEPLWFADLAPPGHCLFFRFRRSYFVGDTCRDKISYLLLDKLQMLLQSRDIDSRSLFIHPAFRLDHVQVEEMRKRLLCH